MANHGLRSSLCNYWLARSIDMLLGMHSLSGDRVGTTGLWSGSDRAGTGQALPVFDS